MNLKCVVMVAAACCATRTIAYSQDESKDNSNGEIAFKVRNAGMDVTGTIKIADLEIQFNENDPGRSHVVATADPNRINTGISIRDNHLRRSDYFDVVRYQRSNCNLGTSKKWVNTSKDILP